MFQNGLGAIAATILATCCLCGSASAITVGNVGSDGNEGPELRMNASGQYVIAWIDLIKSHPVRVISGDVNSPIPEIMGFKSGGLNGLTQGISAGVNDDGTRIVSWRGSTEQDGGVNLARADTPTWLTLSPSAATPTITRLAPLPELSFFGSQEMAVGANGTAMRTWTGWTGDRSNPGSTTLNMSVRDPSGTIGPNTTVLTVAQPEAIYEVDAALDGSGTPTFIWNGGGYGDGCDKTSRTLARTSECPLDVQEHILVASGDGQGGLTPPQQFATSGGCREAAFDEAPSGAAILVLDRYMGNRGAYMYTTRSPGEQFGPLTKLTTPSRRDNRAWLSAMVTPDGRAFAAWGDIAKEAFYTTKKHGGAMSYTERIEASTGVTGGTMSAPRPMSPYIREVSYGPDDRQDPIPGLAHGPSGQPYLFARLKRNRRLQIAAIRPDLSLGRSLAIGRAPGYEPPLAISESGRAIALLPTNAHTLRDFEIVRFTVPAP